MRPVQNTYNLYPHRTVCPICGVVLWYTDYFKDERDVWWNHFMKRHREHDSNYRSANWGEGL